VTIPSVTRDLKELPVSVLAYIGDAVYELYVRIHMCNMCRGDSGQLHRLSIHKVKAQAQADAVEQLIPLLTEDEQSVYKRGRNSQTASRPKRSSPIAYQMATGLEALIGYLSLKHEQNRLDTLMALILKDDTDEGKHEEKSSKE
jgi:ribonuclease III family protein